MDNPAREATGKMGTYGLASSPQGERNISEILKAIIGNLQGLIRSEVLLARAEIKDEGAKLAAASKLLVAGVVLGLYAFGFLLWTAVNALELVLAPWLATLIVGAALCIFAAVAVSVGRERLRNVRMAEKTRQTLKEDVEWMKEQARS